METRKGITSLAGRASDSSPDDVERSTHEPSGLPDEAAGERYQLKDCLRKELTDLVENKGRGWRNPGNELTGWAPSGGSDMRRRTLTCCCKRTSVMPSRRRGESSAGCGRFSLKTNKKRIHSLGGTHRAGHCGDVAILRGRVHREMRDVCATRPRGLETNPRCAGK